MGRQHHNAPVQIKLHLDRQDAVAEIDLHATVAIRTERRIQRAIRVEPQQADAVVDRPDGHDLAVAHPHVDDGVDAAGACVHRDDASRAERRIDGRRIRGIARRFGERRLRNEVDRNRVNVSQPRTREAQVVGRERQRRLRPRSRPWVGVKLDDVAGAGVRRLQVRPFPRTGPVAGEMILIAAAVIRVARIPVRIAPGLGGHPSPAARGLGVGQARAVLVATEPETHGRVVYERVDERALGVRRDGGEIAARGGGLVAGLRPGLVSGHELVPVAVAASGRRPLEVLLRRRRVADPRQRGVDVGERSLEHDRRILVAVARTVDDAAIGVGMDERQESSVYGERRSQWIRAKRGVARGDAVALRGSERDRLGDGIVAELVRVDIRRLRAGHAVGKREHRPRLEGFPLVKAAAPGP